MQNRFGFKDFVLFALVLGLLLLVFASMVQMNRSEQRIMRLQSKLEAVERSVLDSSTEALAAELNELRTVLAARPVNVYVSGGAATTEGATSAGEFRPPTDIPSSIANDDSWARAGVEIVEQPPFGFTNDPKDSPAFSPGGVFTEIFEAQPARVTPFLSTDVYARRVIDRVAEPLAAYDPETLELRGVLAEAWQYDPEGLWVRVRLRSNARFSDGEPVTAEDVRYTFMDFIKNPLIEAERSRALLDGLEDVVVIDDRTVELVFSEALFSNLDAMTTYVLPEHVYGVLEPAQINQSTGLLVGSGRFRMDDFSLEDQWTPGEDIVLVRNERYWGERPALAGLRFRIITNDLAMLVAYRNGDGDMMRPTSPQYAEERNNATFLEENEILDWINMRSGYSFLGWQCGRRGGGEDGRWTPFHDPRVRKAMTMIIDRELMIRDIYEGVGVVATGPNNPASPASNPDIEPWPYDPEAADALFAEAGWVDADGDGVREYQNDDEFFSRGTPFEFEFTISNSGSSSERIIAYLKQTCIENGIVMEPRLVDWSFYTDMLKRRDFDAMIMGWSASAPESDPQQIWHSTSIADQGDNFIQWGNPRGDELIDRGRRTLDFEERMRVWNELHSVIHEDQPYTFLRAVPWLRFVKRDIGNVHMYRSGLEPWEYFRIRGSSPASGG